MSLGFDPWPPEHCLVNGGSLDFGVGKKSNMVQMFAKCIF